VEVDVVPFVQQSKIFRYVAETIWGDVSWPEASRDTALDLLQKGYVRMKKAEEMMSHVRRTLVSTEVLIVKNNLQAQSLTTYQVDPMSPEHEALRLSVLQEASSVIHLIKIPGDPFYPHLQLLVLMWEILAKEKTIQRPMALEGIWYLIRCDSLILSKGDEMVSGGDFSSGGIGAVVASRPRPWISLRFH
jgi:hypothetical protein